MSARETARHLAEEFTRGGPLWTLGRVLAPVATAVHLVSVATGSGGPLEAVLAVLGAGLVTGWITWVWPRECGCEWFFDTDDDQDDDGLAEYGRAA